MGSAVPAQPTNLTYLDIIGLCCPSAARVCHGGSSSSARLSSSLAERMGCNRNEYFCPYPCHAIKNQWQDLRRYCSRACINAGRGELLPRGRRAHPCTRERPCSALSRRHQPGKVSKLPELLQDVPELRLALRDEAYYRTLVSPPETVAAARGAGKSNKLDYHCHTSRAQSQVAALEGSPATTPESSLTR